MRTLATLALAALLSLLASMPAAGITYGFVDTTNQYNYVGAYIVYRTDIGAYRQVCSGTLISPTVFLTASHCTAFVESRGWPSFVTFAPVFDRDNVKTSDLIAATPHTNPNYNQAQSDPGDIAVLVLSKAVKNVAPASLPTAGYFDQLAAQNGLKGQTFLAVGYGTTQAERGPGGLTWSGNGTRRYGYSSFDAIDTVWLRLSQNNATGDSGTCYGDSGGPNFLGNSKLVAALTVTGDSPCYATNVDYRVDTPSARSFLANYITLP